MLVEGWSRVSACLSPTSTVNVRQRKSQGEYDQSTPSPTLLPPQPPLFRQDKPVRRPYKCRTVVLQAHSVRDGNIGRVCVGQPIHKQTSRSRGRGSGGLRYTQSSFPSTSVQASVEWRERSEPVNVRSETEGR